MACLICHTNDKNSWLVTTDFLVGIATVRETVFVRPTTAAVQSKNDLADTNSWLPATDEISATKTKASIVVTPGGVVLYDFAYETRPDTPIRAGSVLEAV